LALFIGIDLGTSGCRAIAIDEHGDIQGNAVVDLPSPTRSSSGNTSGNKGGVEQDAHLWWDAVCLCLSKLTKKINSNEVAAIAVDGTSATLLLADEAGTPLGPALMYNDARATQQAKKIAQVAPDNTAAQGASCALAKLLWFYEKGFYEEGLYDERPTQHVRYALHQADWITGKLCGQFGTSDYNNSLKLGFDAEKKSWPNWVNTLLNKANIPLDILPKVVVPGAPIACLTPELSKLFNISEKTQIVAGTTDSTASFIATGASKKGEAVTALGSTLVLKIISDKPVFAPEYGVYSQPFFNADGEKWLIGGASNTGGSVLRQFFSMEQLQIMTPQLNPETSTGLDYYPLPAAGERFPVNDAQLKSQLEPRPENDIVFFQGILEGIAQIEATGYQLLSDLGAPIPTSVRTTGGGTKNPAWTKIRTSLLNTEKLNTKMINANHTEAAYGAALLAKAGQVPELLSGLSRV
jgi:sugar (pentulose or hexulose) kinase